MNVVAVIFSCPEHFNREWSQFSLLSAPDHTPPSILKYMACGEMTRFKICFLQLYSTFILQGLHLKAKYGAITIPAAWPSLCEIVILLILVPVMESILVQPGVVSVSPFYGGSSQECYWLLDPLGWVCVAYYAVTKLYIQVFHCIAHYQIRSNLKIQENNMKTNNYIKARFCQQ